jgi:hypothetical protein
MNCSFKLIACSVLAAASLSSFAATTDMGAVSELGDAALTYSDASTKFDIADLQKMATDSATAMIIQLTGNPGSAMIVQDTSNTNAALIIQDIQTAGATAFAYINQPSTSIGNTAYINQK